MGRVSSWRRLRQGGAELLILATNTMHKVAPEINAQLSIPFVNIFDATADAIVAAGCSRPALMATVRAARPLPSNAAATMVIPLDELRPPGGRPTRWSKTSASGDCGRRGSIRWCRLPPTGRPFTASSSMSYAKGWASAVARHL